MNLERPDSEWFGVIIDAAQYESRLDSLFSDRWPFYCKFGHDSYDASIELYFSPECPPEWIPTPEDMAFLKSYGATFGWMNFTDGTQIHFSQGAPNIRETSHAPRWSKKRWREEEVGHELTDEEAAQYL